MSMYFSKAELRPDAAARDLAPLALGDGYAAHQLIWRLFADDSDRRRDFLYRAETERQRPVFYIVSARPPEDRDGLWAVQTKPYAPRLATGQALAFRLRANPVRARREAKDGPLRRHDVVMDLKTRMRAADPSAPLPALPALVQEAGYRWLAERGAKHGFRVDEGALRVDGYRQHRLYKGRQRERIQLSTLDFDGVLTVTDPTALVEALYQGLGPAKGFGCGLLLVRRA